jgi:hypothetical protein
MLLPIFSLIPYLTLQTLIFSDKIATSEPLWSTPTMSSNTNSRKLRLQQTKDAENIQEHADQHSDEIDSDGLCERCASISWESLADPSKVPPDELPFIYETTKDLMSSACHVCRFLGNVITSREMHSFPSVPPYQFKLNGNMTVDNQNIGLLQFIRTREGALWPLSRHDDPHVLVIQSRPSSVNQPCQSLMIGGMPLEILKHSIATCQREHSDRCSPKSPSILRNLKVFDCETCEVVLAPVDCRYVALSYVWGTEAAHTKATTSSTPNSLPKTIADSCFIVQSLGYKYLWVDRYVSLRIL